MKKTISIVCIIVFFLGIAVFFVSWGKSQAPEEIVESNNGYGSYESYPSNSIGEDCTNVVISNPEPFSESQKIFSVAPEESGTKCVYIYNTTEVPMVISNYPWMLFRTPTSSMMFGDIMNSGYYTRVYVFPGSSLYITAAGN